MFKNSLSTFLIFVTVAIVFLIGGYAAGAGYFSSQEASFYGSPVVAQRASYYCQKNPTDPKCNPTIAKPADLGTTGPMGGDIPAGLKSKTTIPVAPGFYYWPVNGGQGCRITAESTEKSFIIDLPCPFNAPSTPSSSVK